MEELGIATVTDRGLAVDWVSADGFGAPVPAVSRRDRARLRRRHLGRGPDCGVRLPDHEITGIEFVEPARLRDRLSPSDARRALSALRARINATGTVLLENGLPIAPTVLDRLAVLHTVRAELHHPWREGPSPARADGDAGSGLAVRTGRARTRPPRTRNRHRLSARRCARAPGPGRPGVNTVPRGREACCGPARNTAVPRAPHRSPNATHPPALRREVHRHRCPTCATPQGSPTPVPHRPIRTQVAATPASWPPRNRPRSSSTGASRPPPSLPPSTGAADASAYPWPLPSPSPNSLAPPG
ncbi:hypothetical protein [Streptomyces sp. NPDC048155]|uniref:hypothetical protein n=1 Tax=Streptomyces sp. NPDC048155 TaxID=3154818 RepID=UPI0033C96A9C